LISPILAASGVNNADLGLQAHSPISAVAQERVRFDMQLISNPKISEIEYQQEELQAYEVREYLLAK